MGQVTLDARTHDRLRFAANLLDLSEAKVIALLLDRAEKANPPENQGEDRRVPIHEVYRSKRVEALYDRLTRSIEITTGPLKGQVFSTPSRAATEVIRSIDPNVNPHRNGWGNFWLVTATGERLQSIRHE